MKTPREILLERQQAVEPRLDAIRAEVLSVECSRAVRGERQSPLLVRAGVKLWRELIWPYRRAWAGMAAAWLAIWVANARLADAPEVLAARARPVSVPAMIQALEEQRRLLAELIPPADLQPPDPPPHHSQKRSERQTDWAIS